MKRVTLGCLLALVALFMLAPVASASITLRTPERQLLALVNHARTSRGLHRLTVVTSLERAARAHSSQMVAKTYFSHDSYSGESFSSRLIRFGYGHDGYTSWKVGENIAYGSGDLGAPKAIFRAWMKSSAHRAIILTKAFRNVGVGRAVGTYDGMSGVVFFTLDCGVRTK